jgi:hypothetical protein
MNTTVAKINKNLDLFCGKKQRITPNGCQRSPEVFRQSSDALHKYPEKHQKYARKRQPKTPYFHISIFEIMTYNSKLKVKKAKLQFKI